MTFDPFRPYGSPLSSSRYPEAPAAAPGPFDDTPPPMAQQNYQLPDTTGINLPKPPPRKAPSPWDKEHISETLADIGSGFFSSQNFGEGFGNAAKAIAGRSRQIREQQRPDISYGGPDDQFEISTDRTTGERTVREVPQFRAAIDRKRTAQLRPDAKTLADLRGRAVNAIATQVPPEQRAAAYQRLVTHPEQFGIDVAGMPAEWDDTYGALAGTMGMNVSQAQAQGRGDQLASSLIEHRKAQEAQGDQRVQQGAARVQQGAARVAQGAAKLRTPPAAARKGYSIPTSKAQFDALPSGAKFKAPDGSLRIKP